MAYSRHVPIVLHTDKRIVEMPNERRVPPAELQDHAVALVAEAARAAAASPNEANLRHLLERALDQTCSAFDRPLDPFRLEFFVREGKRRRFIDVAHGGVLIEYEAPNSFRGREAHALLRARDQLEEYAVLLQHEEGRPLDEYTLVAWDGAHVSFGRFQEGVSRWERLTAFDSAAAVRLLTALLHDGVPLVSPRVLSELIGPESELGAQIIPELFKAVRTAVAEGEKRTSNTYLLFTEWRRLFGQVVGSQSDQLHEMLAKQSAAHRQPYREYVAEYLFALNTYIALVAKLVAALSLPDPAENIVDANVPIADRIQQLESGKLFAHAGVLNVLVGDFFSWYAYDASWPEFEPKLGPLLDRLNTISFDVTKKTPESTRDLFKGLYQSFVPRALRHALGEYYTPDWLASHTLDRLGWQTHEPLLDPTCGSGTFILEALRRRLCDAEGKDERTAKRLLHGLYGLDLNPLAVLTARASLVVFLSPYLDPGEPIRLPIFLADALNPTMLEGDLYTHRLQTELGTMRFAIPRRLVKKYSYYDFFNRLRELIDAGGGTEEIIKTLLKEFDFGLLTEGESEALRGTVENLVLMHHREWNGIWCALLADRFSTGEIPPIERICGNPPWVKWSHLPPAYAEFIKDRCYDMGVFSDDRWVGGIESDISTVVTYEAVARWLAPNGRLAFLITGTVFSNESSQGFRRFRLRNADLRFGPVAVEDFSRLNPFEGVSNFATLMILERERETEYPIPFRVWRPRGQKRKQLSQFASSAEFAADAESVELLASPVPGTDAGPWIIGTSEDHELWKKMFHPGNRHYVARKGVTTDRNGIFFLRLGKKDASGRCAVENDPSVGRKPGIPKIRSNIEADHLFPLLRGRGVSAFRAVPDEEYHILVPQRGMHGDESLPYTARFTYAFLNRFRGELEKRSSYRRFQPKQPFWSLWSTGAYTFSPHKVVWREMGGGTFAAAYISTKIHEVLGEKVVVPDHKLYFVPLETEGEAAYLTGVLNAPVVAHAVSSYAAQLSLGVSVVEYLDIPNFDDQIPTHASISALSRNVTVRGGGATPDELNELDRLAYLLFDL